MIWAFAYDCRVKKIVLLQKRAIRIIDGSQSPPLFMELNLLKFRQIKLYQTAVFVYKYALAILPSRFDNYFTTGTEIHSHFITASKSYRTMSHGGIKYHLRQSGKEQDRRSCAVSSEGKDWRGWVIWPEWTRIEEPNK